MKKSHRQKKIIDIVNNYEIDTQEELVEKLKELDIDVTQATVSRDTKELGLIKVSGVTKKFKYAYQSYAIEASAQIDMLKNCIKSFDSSLNIIVGKTIAGFAQTACAIVDSLNINDIIGTIGGDDSFLIVTRPHATQNILTLLEGYIND